MGRNKLNEKQKSPQLLIKPLQLLSCQHSSEHLHDGPINISFGGIAPEGRTSIVLDSHNKSSH